MNETDKRSKKKNVNEEETTSTYWSKVTFHIHICRRGCAYSRNYTNYTRTVGGNKNVNFLFNARRGARRVTVNGNSDAWSGSGMVEPRRSQGFLQKIKTNNRKKRVKRWRGSRVYVRMYSIWEMSSFDDSGRERGRAGEFSSTKTMRICCGLNGGNTEEHCSKIAAPWNMQEIVT